jgi:hypothetical protein
LPNKQNFGRCLRHVSSGMLPAVPKIGIQYDTIHTPCPSPRIRSFSGGSNQAQLIRWGCWKPFAISKGFLQALTNQRVPGPTFGFVTSPWFVQRVYPNLSFWCEHGVLNFWTMPFWGLPHLHKGAKPTFRPHTQEVPSRLHRPPERWSSFRKLMGKFMGKLKIANLGGQVLAKSREIETIRRGSGNP